MNAMYRFLSSYQRAIAAAVLCLVVVAIFVGGARPFAVNLIPSPWDKIAHCMTFAVLGAAAGIALGARTPRGLLCTALGAVAFGALDEFHQTMLPGRNAGWDDLAADTLGAILGAVAIHGLRRINSKVAPDR